MSWQEQLQKRSVVYGSGTLASVVLVLGILVVIALLANWHQYRWDVTSGQTQSLSTASRTLLKEVNQPLTMTVFLPEGHADRQQARDILQRYVYHNSHVSITFVDPERDPLKAQEAGFRFPGNVLLDYQGRRQMADRAEEDAITNTLRKILKPEHKKLYFLTGHGERDLDDPRPGGFQVAKRALENEGYEVKTLNLLTESQIPKDAAVVVVAAPKKPLLANETQVLKTFLTQGGRVLVMLEAFQDGGLMDFLTAYGVGLDDGMVLDVNQVSRALGVSAVMPLVAQYGPSKITQDFKNIVTVFPMARPLLIKHDVPGMTPPLALATTMASSYEKLGKEWLKAGQGAFNPKEDKKGPFTLATLTDIKMTASPGDKEKKESKAPGRAEDEDKTYLVAYGSVDFAANAYFNLFGNGDLFLNSVNFLAKETKQITIREAKKAQVLTLTGGQIWTLFFVTLVWAPLVMLGVGIWVYRRRRAAR